MISCLVRLVLLGTALPVVALAQPAPFVVPLWAGGAPGFEDRRDEPELAEDYWVRNVHHPSLTVYLPPPERATGAAVVVFPGGGHRELVFEAEGRDAADFLTGLGVAAFVVKYRLAYEVGSPYTVETHVRQDAYRALRTVRSRAAEWGVDPERIGVLGFSAGGEVAALVAYAPGDGDPAAPDPVERADGRPDFQVLVYPGPRGIPDVVPPDAPPAFLVVAGDDPCCAGPTLTLLQRYHAAGVPVEAHVYGQGGHAFNMGQRSTLPTLSSWPRRMADWLAVNGLLTPRPNSPEE
jgi:acetyl esterase/lipase